MYLEPAHYPFYKPLERGTHTPRFPAELFSPKQLEVAEFLQECEVRRLDSVSDRVNSIDILELVTFIKVSLYDPSRALLLRVVKGNDTTVDKMGLPQEVILVDQFIGMFAVDPKELNGTVAP